MNYPEKGADYRHKPKWLEGMKRAEGGAAGRGKNSDYTTGSTADDVAAFDKLRDRAEVGKTLSDQQHVNTLLDPAENKGQGPIAGKGVHPEWDDGNEGD